MLFSPRVFSTLRTISDETRVAELDVQANPMLSDPLGVRARAVDAADFDGDGRADVALGGDSTEVIYIRIPTGQFGSGSAPPDLRGVIAFDVNSDGWPDVANASRAQGTVNVSVNGRFGGNSFGFSAPFRFTVGAGARAVAAADLDGDGRTDLVSANQYARTVTVMINQSPRFAPTSDVK